MVKLKELVEEKEICNALYPNRLCADCGHLLQYHVEGPCQGAFGDGDEEIDCKCLQWVDSGKPYVKCFMPIGPNATTDPVMEEQEDENGEPIIVEITPPQPRHVHKGAKVDEQGNVVEVVRWGGGD